MTKKRVKPNKTPRIENKCELISNHLEKCEKETETQNG